MRWPFRRTTPQPTIHTKPDEGTATQKARATDAVRILAHRNPYRRPTFRQWSRTAAAQSYRDHVERFAVARQREAVCHRMAEQFGDPDDDIVGLGGGHSQQYRAVTKQGETAVPLEIVRAISESRYLFVKSPLKAACDSLTARYTAGDGVTYAAADDRVQDVIDEFMADPYNACLENIEELAKRFRIDGQLVLLTTVSEDGRVRIRRWDPRDVVSVRFEDDNPEAPEYLRIIGAKAPEPAKGEEDTREAQQLTAPDRLLTSTWRVIRQRDPDGPDAEAPDGYSYASRAEEPGQLDGDVFWFRANSAIADLGLPDGVAAFHVFDQYDELRATAMNAARLKTIYGLSIGVEGFTLDDLQELEESYRLPDDPAIFFHNEKGTIEALTFDLGANQIEEHLLGLKKLALSTYGFPPSFVAEDNATLATALAQSAPTLKAMQSKQAELREALRVIMRFVVEQAERAGTLAGVEDTSVEVQMSPLSADQSQTQAGTLNAITLSLSGAVSSGIVSREVAARVFQNAVINSDLITTEEISEVLSLAPGEPVPLPDIDDILALPPPERGEGPGSSIGLSVQRLHPEEQALIKAWEQNPDAVTALLR